MRKLIILSIILWGKLISYSQNHLSFEEEDITFEIQDSVFSVEGIYYFNSEKDGIFPIVYPFPTDTIYSNPFDIFVQNMNTSDTIIYHTKSDFASIDFAVQIEGETAVLIKYRQKLKTNKAEYILTTTQSWGKPLKHVDYKLVTNEKLYIKSFSYNPDKKIKIDDKRIYIWQKKDFMPLQNFEVFFETL